MQMLKHPCVGDVVVFHGPCGEAHNALVTAYWGEPTLPDGSVNPTLGCLNLVFVSDDESRHDDYGRQIERNTSISYKSTEAVHGFYWRWPEDEPNPYRPPSSV